MLKNIKEERLRWFRPILEKEISIKNLVKVCPYETPIWIKEKVIALRKETKLCAKKLHWILKKQGLIVPVSTIGKILKKEVSYNTVFFHLLNKEFILKNFSFLLLMGSRISFYPENSVRFGRRVARNVQRGIDFSYMVSLLYQARTYFQNK